jgi:hypothetical protein
MINGLGFAPKDIVLLTRNNRFVDQARVTMCLDTGDVHILFLVSQVDSETYEIGEIPSEHYAWRRVTLDSGRCSIADYDRSGEPLSVEIVNR